MTARLALPVLLLALAATLPATAHAHAVMSVEGSTLRMIDSDATSLNTPTIGPGTSGRVRFSDPTAYGGVGIGNAQSCIPVNETVVECDMTGLTTIRVDVGPGNDKITYGTSFRSQLVGREGNDTIDGGSGDDSAEGGDGADRITGGPGRDSLGGGLDDDELMGGDGDDVITGGLGTDVADGAAGNDELRIRDGTADRAACGDGSDRVVADEADVAGAEQGCEAVERAAPGTGEPGGGGGFAAGALQVRLGGVTRQRLSAGRVAIDATATRAAELTPTGVLKAGGRHMSLTGPKRRVTVDGGGVVLTLRVTPAARALARRALRAHRRVTVAVLVLARDASGARARRRMPSIVLR